MAHRDQSYAQIPKHLDECAPCLREYGLEEAVKRLVDKSCGAEAVPRELRIKMMSRIRKVRADFGITQEPLDSQDHRPT
jgi:mycothiol system anti-sigma-R factor